jgi:hypothetical protein
LINFHSKESAGFEIDKGVPLKANTFDRDNAEADKLIQAQEFLLTEFPEINDVLDRRNIS